MVYDRYHFNQRMLHCMISNGLPSNLANILSLYDVCFIFIQYPISADEPGKHINLQSFVIQCHFHCIQRT